MGSKGASPRSVKVPKGIDPGFAYNPGKAYLEPLTVPPLTSYADVLTLRKKPWPTDFKAPEASPATKVSANIRMPKGTNPVIGVEEFLGIFGATLEQGGHLPMR